MKHPPGTILHFSRFQFEEEATATRPAEKNKFFIVLRNKTGRMVVACLPSSKDRIPEAAEQRHGCVVYPRGGFTVYVFEALRPVATNGWFFSLRTYMYAFGVRTYSYEILERNHTAAEREVSVKGRLHAGEFMDMVNCLLKSIDIKRKMQRALEGVRYDEDESTQIVGEPMPRYGAAD